MRQRLFTPKYSEALEANVEENLSKYLDPNYNWEDDANGEIRELDFEQPDLSGMMAYANTSLATDDFKAAKILFEAYNDLISPLQAAQSHFWQYLSHVVLKDYMRARWPRINQSDCPASYIQEHWFYGQGRIRNWLEGLYWSMKCTAIVNEDGSFDYKYSEFMFSIQKLRDRGIAAATYVISNPAIVQGMLDFYIDELKKKDEGQDTVFDKYFEYRTDKCIQLINKLGGVVELSVMSKDDIYKFLNDNRDYIKSVQDRKKEKKLRDEAAAAEAAATEQLENSSSEPHNSSSKSSRSNKKKKRKHRRR